MEDNKVAIQSGLRAEIAEGFMDKLKTLSKNLTLKFLKVKVDLVDELATAHEELEEKFNVAVSQSYGTTGRATNLISVKRLFVKRQKI